VEGTRSIRSRPAGVGRAARAATLCALLYPLLAGCEPGRDEEPALAPRLLHDQNEIAAYVEAFPIDEFTVAEVPGVGRFYVDDSADMVNSVLRSGEPWEPAVLALFREHVEPGTTVLDVGAHVGSLSVPLARLVGPSGRLYAFEPQSRS